MIRDETHIQAIIGFVVAIITVISVAGGLFLLNRMERACEDICVYSEGKVVNRANS